MKLPIAYDSPDGEVTEVVLRKPTGAVLAEVSRLADQGVEFPAIAAFLKGTSLSLTVGGHVVGDRHAVEQAVKAMPWSLAEWTLIRALVLAGVDPIVDVPYQCPKCAKMFERFDPVDITKLAFGKAGDPEADGWVQLAPPSIEYALLTPVSMRDLKTDEVLEEVESIEVGLGTIEDCSRARGRTADNVRMQYMVWFDSIRKVNGAEPDRSWRAKWSGQLFEQMDSDDLHGFSEAVAAYSLVNEVPVVCPSCGKEFDQEVPTSSFFASGLRRVSKSP
jgi:hypothetical protein